MQSSEEVAYQLMKDFLSSDGKGLAINGDTPHKATREEIKRAYYEAIQLTKHATL